MNIRNRAVKNKNKGKYRTQKNTGKYRTVTKIQESAGFTGPVGALMLGA